MLAVVWDWKHLLWMGVGAVVLKAFQWWWGWLERAFLLGFKAVMIEQARLGRNLTKEERDTILAKCKAKLNRDLEAEAKKLDLD
jgi:hypothetical protein